MALLFAAYFIMNIAGLVIMWEDKRRAKRHEYRIRERTLWLVALFGGAVGTTAGMQLYRHKTKHLNFKIGFPILAIIEVILLIKVLL
ncbi:DUF1294 domain-containing protein [Neobacillus bataviensis]|uniref:DUF1294 domain-containing protein n=1 Tax=Neobacillus bataviensis TaxID=220685 RepID=UPI001CBFA0E6|nr:DUF1294 domain-containing protein [Neobacillus bataviensis]